jgi:hypothetical protein
MEAVAEAEQHRAGARDTIAVKEKWISLKYVTRRFLPLAPPGDAT